MMSLAEAARAVDGFLSGEDVAIAGVTTDSRRIATGDLFVALQGERFDGNAFAAEAVARGAAAALVSRRVEGDAPVPQVLVPDTRVALGKLAAAWRARFSVPVVALTGSNGKTTVKEMIAAILASYCGFRADLLATEGNFNNDIGMPLTLLRLRERHRYAVLEMGMNHAGEIDYLTRIAQPTVALVNNAHRAHVGLLGSVEAIARAKGEIYAGLRPNGIAILNADDAYAPLWRELNRDRRVVAFGFGEDANVRGQVEGDQLRLVTPTDAFAVTLQVAGEHNARNAVAACAAAFALEIPPHAIQHGLNGFAGVPGRQQHRTASHGATVIDDTYNANPDSMKAAARVLGAARGRKVFVIGDMGEVGETGPQLHAEVGAFAKAQKIDRMLALGEASREAVRAFGSGAEHFATLEALLEAVRAEDHPGTTILVKGSRFMQMERVAESLAPGGGLHAA
ncbi:UDP-N-acetylmuramoyl-tripeptide--D-alanyl-D-alanine ligase [Betaproteobacteria bacterium GR16-43]|nr:UDP-N-acetylmuramoyl-tripeptide--D-alanyl-D-alanine ligase [Betaproteobacteria bacterium GR16-43]